MNNAKLIESIIPAYEQLKAALPCNDLICITGPPSVGKTTMAKLVFQENEQFLYAYVSCYDVSIPSQLYTRICNQFHSKMNVRTKQQAGKLIGSYYIDKPVSVQDFPNYCKEYDKIARNKRYKKLFVVIDQIELLRGTPLMDSIALFVTIPCLSLIIITNKSPTKVVNYMSNSRIILIAQDRMLPIFVGTWSKADTIEAILESPPSRGAQLYKTFVTNVVTLVYMTSTKNVREIKLYCQENFEEFLSYYKDKVKDRMRKRSHESDEYETNSTCIDLDDQDVSKGYTANLTASFLQSFKVMIQKRDMNSWRSNDVETKLPLNTSTLMVAAYVAAHTKPSDDKKNFVKYQRRLTRREKRDGVDIQSRVFTLERLIHIYLALMRRSLGEENLHNIWNNDFVLSDVERLESLNILQIHSGDGISSDTRYKLSSCVRRSYIERIARHSELNLDHIHGL